MRDTKLTRPHQRRHRGLVRALAAETLRERTARDRLARARNDIDDIHEVDVVGAGDEDVRRCVFMHAVPPNAALFLAAWVEPSETHHRARSRDGFHFVHPSLKAWRVRSLLRSFP
jgi:hypothetical protein